MERGEKKERLEDEMRAAMRKMKSERVVGPDDLSVEAWQYLREMTVEFLTTLFNTILQS